MTSIEWLKNYGGGMSKRDACMRCSQDLGIEYDSVRRSYNKHFPYGIKTEKKPTELPSTRTLETLSKTFGKTEVLKRTRAKLFLRMDDLIKSKFTNGVIWLPEQEVFDEGLFTREEQSIIRENYSSMIIPNVQTDNNRRMTIWILPEYYEKALEEINK